PKSLVKLFQDPLAAEKASHELKAHGFKDEEIGTLRGGQDGGLSLPGVGSVKAQGPVAAALADAGGDPGLALAKLWGLPQDALAYYEVGLSLGGVVVSVHAPDKRLQKARTILRSAEHSSPVEQQRTPGFLKAGRMSGTNPIDAQMTGDFRRY
ncbi:MAG: hypothetical protein Q8O76_03240, partial [Chloroflexota bacterium]|nr:hypothetical protein [Chloroflexota bacterium]